MKNLFTVLGLFFAFTLTSFAQEEIQQKAAVSAKAELLALNKVVALDDQIATGLNSLLVYKHEMVARFPEKKEEVAKTIGSKLESTLTPEQFTKVKNNKVLYNDLLY